ncbi:MAG: phosphoribosylanthranilate isomerase [Alphaproteobacteria bacterium]|nr:phosphoribosylanthranilate isomerase [Alphaproteobacteria bacterium]MBU0797259.1 phosphoribosylanthranilate isomerase [Alphaproteobacteria bacterium]MBU0888953.1 phosphoribosylanthranilate isomerase [Alphaproteobacteria bacterium]MBU1813973.1 phosphoribosylanthranilate isomerase [Alphaproteobacteria bacterium]
MTQVKICGLSTPESVAAAIEGGADYLGFVFYPRSPRNVTPEQAALLAAPVPLSVQTVALTVDASDALLQTIIDTMGPAILQLHGHETPERVTEIRQRFGVPVMKVLSVAGPEDVAAAHAYEDIADRLMFDARPPKDMANALPGGNALRFDWTLLAGTSWKKPWLLAGGLTPDNVAEAIRISGAPGVDVSSGVEDAPGRKSIPLIQAFLKAAKTA